MLKSSRNKIYLGLIFGLALFTTGAAQALPIDHITILGLSNNPSFTAGVATNTTSTTIFFNTFTSTNGVPSPGQVVTLELLDNNSVIDHGMTPASFTTTGNNSLNGGNASLPLTFFRAGTAISVRATAGSVTTASNNFTVVASSATKLVVLGPGMTHVPGTDPAFTTGVSGTFSPQEANQQFQITVILTDNQFNKVSRGDTVSFASTDLIDLPPSGPLTAGIGNFNVTITGAQIARTIAVSDTSDATVHDGSLDVNTQGPPAKEVFPFPSPFNPHERNITFRFRLSEAKNCELTVINLFGEKVWQKSVSAALGTNDITWDGRNERGAIVAQGVYYVMLKVDGSLESKKRFGVIK